MSIPAVVVPLHDRQYRAGMGKSRKKPLTADQLAACRRLRALWKKAKAEHGVTQEAVANAIGTTQGAFSHFMHGYTAISLEALPKLATFFGVSPSDIDPALARKLLTASAQDGDWVDLTARAQGVALGHGAEIDEWAETHKLKFRADSLRKKGLIAKNLEIYFGKGDSMQPRISDGDAILYDMADKAPAHGKIFILRWRGGLMAKRLRIYDGRIWISSDNKSDPQWRDDVPADPEREDFEIVGRVRWIASWEP